MTILYSSPNKNKSFLIFKPNIIIKNIVKSNKIYKEIYAIIKRLYLQNSRRPYNIFISIAQPILWLILFGALFQNAPINLFDQYTLKYEEFLNPGIIIFTSFNSAINAGLPIIFDREFGFFNRLLVSPLIYKNTIIISTTINIWIITILQIISIIIISIVFLQSNIKISQLFIIILINTFIIIYTANISIFNAFTLPGHIEFIALAIIINLPILFLSTALAPLGFMPYWLQIAACLNPLTYGIEIIRNIVFNNKIILEEDIINTIYFQITVNKSILILTIINIISSIVVHKFIKYKYD
uniref:ABC transmembrane type-2 domain-containing protein n=1 Tax=Sonderella linearis TaxID=110477 RepID=A0A1Z1MMW2_9FLOR|nr:hypothetical protein [Sonderella linearis]ARW67101.1 hypothetical protein [Sonderella linearis]